MMFKVKGRLVGRHYLARVYAGSGYGALGLCGELMMRPEEYRALCEVLKAAGKERIEIEIEDEDTCAKQ